MNIFITGGTGLLGGYLVDLFKLDHNIYAPTHDEFDITNPIFPDYFDGVDIVINCAAFTDIAECEKNPSFAYKVNSDSLDWLVSLPKNIQVYHISTDYVYDGHTHNSRETDLLNPWCIYGKSKAAGDTRLLSFSRPNIHIIRTSFKNKIWPYPVAFFNVYTNADTVDNISDLIYRFVCKSPPAGVYNIGTETKSLFGLASRTNKDMRMSLFSQTDYPTLRPILTMDLSKSKKILGI